MGDKADSTILFIRSNKIIFFHLTKLLLQLPPLCGTSMKWTTTFLLRHFLHAFAYPADPFPSPFFHDHHNLIKPIMGICFRKPAKCAHASSTNFSGQSLLFILYKLDQFLFISCFFLYYGDALVIS